MTRKSTSDPVPVTAAQLLQTWATRIAAAMEVEGIGPAAVASALGVNVSTVHRWTAAQVEPPMHAKLRLALVLRTSVAELFPWSEAIAA